MADFRATADRGVGSLPTSYASRMACWRNIGTFYRTRRPGPSRRAADQCSALNFPLESGGGHDSTGTTIIYWKVMHHAYQYPLQADPTRRPLPPEPDYYAGADPYACGPWGC